MQRDLTLLKAAGGGVASTSEPYHHASPRLASPLSRRMNPSSPSRPPPFGTTLDIHHPPTPTSQHSHNSTSTAALDQEYASVSHLRKARELGGHQMAQLLHFPYYSPPPPSMSPGMEEGAVLAEQIRARREAQALAKQRELEQELAQVKYTTERFQSRAEEEDLRLREKRREAMRFLLESEQMQREKILEAKRREREAEERARAEREWLRARHHHQQVSPAAAGKRVAAADSPERIMQHILSGVPLSSPLHEALRRLMEAHLYELDVIAPLLQDILLEPEFAISPWY